MILLGTLSYDIFYLISYHVDFMIILIFYTLKYQSEDENSKLKLSNLYARKNSPYLQKKQTIIYPCDIFIKKNQYDDNLSKLLV